MRDLGVASRFQIFVSYLSLITYMNHFIKVRYCLRNLDLDGRQRAAEGRVDQQKGSSIFLG